MFWDWLEGLGSGLRRDDPCTWSSEAWPGHQPFGFLTSHGASQCAAAWRVRSHPSVVRAFSAIWRTDDLLVSLDAPITWRPWWIDASWTPVVERLHVDQNPFHKPGFQCVQGMVPLVGQTALSGGLQLVPHTHTDAVQQHLRTSYPHLFSDPDDWCELAPGDPFLGKGQLPVAGRGDLILWDSRLIHGGLVGTGPTSGAARSLAGQARASVRGIRNRTWRVLTGAPGCAPGAQNGNRVLGGESPQLARLSCTVCMTERCRATAAALQRRRDAVAAGAALTHWPHQPTAHTLWDTGGARIGAQKFIPPRLSATQLALIG